MLKSKCGGFFWKFAPSTLDHELINHPLSFLKPTVITEFTKWTVFQQTVYGGTFIYFLKHKCACLRTTNILAPFNTVNTICIVCHYWLLFTLLSDALREQVLANHIHTTWVYSPVHPQCLTIIKICWRLRETLKVCFVVQGSERQAGYAQMKTSKAVQQLTIPPHIRWSEK